MSNVKESGHKDILVEMTNIHKWFGRVHALRGVDIQVKHPEILGLVGDNGAGKSTLIKVLSGFYPPDQGEIYFEGKKVDIRSSRDAQRLGIETVYQEQALAPEINISRNIFMGREPTKLMGLLDKEYMNQNSMEALEEVGLQIRSPTAKVAALSGGQRQGVAIARAFYFKAKLVILDEPTRALSVKGVEQVHEFIRELKAGGISTIFITHNLQHVFSVADRFVVLGRGVKTGEVKKEDTSLDELSELLVRKPDLD